MSKSKLHLADFQSFKYTNACLCCKRPWTIRVSPEVEPEIRASKLYKNLKDEGYAPLTEQENGDVCASHKENEHCVFLDDNSLCGLHSELGPRKKPIGCQMFPYRATRTPSGTYVSLSFTCPSVVAGIKNDLEVNRTDLTEILSRWPQTAAVRTFEAAQLTKGYRLDWDEYLKIEPWLLDNYDPQQPLRSLLSMAANISAFTLKMCSWPPPAGSPIEEEFLEEIMTSYLVAIIPLIEAQKTELDINSYMDKLMAREQVYSNHLEALAPVLDPKRSMSSWAMGRYHDYYKNQVAGKTLVDPSVVVRLLSLAIDFAILAHYAEGARRIRKEDEISVDSLTQAFYIMGGAELSHSQALLNFYQDFEATLPKLLDPD